MNPTIKKTAVNYGLITAAIAILYTVIAYTMNYELFTNWMAGILIFVVTLVVFILAVRNVKSKQDGYLTFKEGFSTFVISWIISAAIGVIFNILLFNVIDPAAGDAINEIRIESQIEMFEGFGMDDAALDEAIKEIEKADQFAIGTQVQGFVWSVLFGAILGLIVAAAFKKNKPLYEDENTVDAD